MKKKMLIFLAMLLASSIVHPVQASDFVLGIFGNANMDEDIDEKDIAYLERVIKGTNLVTNLSDANYDGKIDTQDIDQIKQIISGNEKELAFLAPIYPGRPSPPEIVTIKKPVKRIEVLMPDTAEVLRSLNAEDEIVGVGTSVKDRKDFFPELSNLPGIGSWMGSGLDYEAMLNLKPDLFLAFVKGPQYLDEDKLPGVTVISVYPMHPGGFLERVKLLGYIIDKEDEAEQYIKWHEDWLNQIHSRTSGLSDNDKPRVFHWSFFKPDGEYKTIDRLNRIHEMSELAGGKDVAEDLNGTSWPTVSAEWVMTKNPEIIVAQASDDILCGYGTNDPSEMMAAREYILNLSELANIDAVKSKNVYMMALVDTATGGSGCLIGTAYMAKWFHPDLFKDLDPQAIHQEYLTRFQHLDYDLEKHGVFVYPPLK